MMFLVPDAVNLETLTNDFVSFVCEGECWVFISPGKLLKSKNFKNLKDIQCSRRHYNSSERSDNWCFHWIRKVRRLTYSVENTSFCDTKTLNLSFIVRGGMANTQSKAATGMLDNRLWVMLISCLCFQRRTCAPRTRVATAASVSTAKRTTSASVDVALPAKTAKDVRHNNKHPTGVDCNKLDSLTKNKPSTHKTAISIKLSQTILHTHSS